MLVQVRGDMIVLILATDMARHAEILDNFRQKLDNFDYSSEVNYPNDKYSTWGIKLNCGGNFVHLYWSVNMCLIQTILVSPQIF